MALEGWLLVQHADEEGGCPRIVAAVHVARAVISAASKHVKSSRQSSGTQPKTPPGARRPGNHAR